MKRSGPPLGDLLNLPLTDAPASPEPLGERLEAQDLLPFDVVDSDERFEEDVVLPSAPPREAGFGRRLKAGLLDIAVIAAVVAVATGGAWALGATPRLSQLPGFVLFTVSFSFLYTIVPLTFWSRTPGMSASDLVARSGSDTPLTIQQAIKRWIGGAATLLLCGLPALLILTGRSVGDRLSHSRVKRRGGDQPG
jgi:uncharacterized RDD family membrane protein YckC